MNGNKLRPAGLAAMFSMLFWLFLALLAPRALKAQPSEARTPDDSLNGFVAESNGVRIGSFITVVLTNVAADRAPWLNKTNSLLLELSGVPFPNLCRTICWSNSSSARLRFELAFNSTNRPQWTQVLRNPRQIPVTIGLGDDTELNCGNNFRLVAMDRIEVVLAGALLFLFGYVSFFLATRTEMVRDPASPSQPLPPGLATPPAQAPAHVAPPPPQPAAPLLQAAPPAQAAPPPINPGGVVLAPPAAAGAHNPASNQQAAQPSAAAMEPPDTPAAQRSANWRSKFATQDEGRTNMLIWAVPLVAWAIGVDRADSAWNATLVATLAWILVGVTLWWFLWHFRTYWRTTKKTAEQLRPYSLARVQMAVWFFLIVCSWVFLWLLTGTFNTLTNTVLALMGIGAGTALGAEVQDASKPTTSENILSQIKDIEAKVAQDTAVPIEKKQLESLKTQLIQASQNKPPTTVGFFDDMMTDADGTSFHRFQMFVWTVVLAIVFVVQVCQQLAMPEFDGTLLALMGISSGTYLGFMIKEPHSSAQSS